MWICIYFCETDPEQIQTHVLQIYYFQNDEAKLDSFFKKTGELAAGTYLRSVFSDKYRINRIVYTLGIDNDGNASEILDFFTFCNQSETKVSNDTTQDGMHQNGINPFGSPSSPGTPLSSNS